MLYLIGLGLELKDLNFKSLEALKKCSSIYIDTYTTSLPYSIDKIKKFFRSVGINGKIVEAERNMLEEEVGEILEKARKMNIAICVYGDVFVATTHSVIVEEAKKLKIKIKTIHNVSIINIISEIVSAYNLGKIASLPKWQVGYKPLSFVDRIKENLSINASTLLLVDPQLSFEDAVKELGQAFKEKKLKKVRIIVCSRVGTKEEKIIHTKINSLKKLRYIQHPFCFIILPKNI